MHLLLPAKPFVLEVQRPQVFEVLLVMGHQVVWKQNQSPALKVEQVVLLEALVMGQVVELLEVEAVTDSAEV